MPAPRTSSRRALVARGAPLRDILTGRSSQQPARLRPHPDINRHVRQPPARHPATPHPDTIPRVPVKVTPDIGLSRPIGTSGGPPPANSGAFGPNPPATLQHWLGGVGHAVTPGPAMSAVSVEMIKLGFYARRQLDRTWSHIHSITRTIH